MNGLNQEIHVLYVRENTKLSINIICDLFHILYFFFSLYNKNVIKGGTIF